MKKNLFSVASLLNVIVLFLTLSINGNAQALVAETTANSNAINPMPQINFDPYQFNFNNSGYAPDGVQALLFDNGSAFNVPGPPPISFLQDSSLGMDTFGFGCQFTAGNSMMDDFELVATSTISSIDFYTYQTGSSSVSITGVFVQIYDGEPGAGGSVIWGDLFTNILLNAELTGGFRQLESAPGDTSRQVQKVTANMGDLTLDAGTYWVEVSFDGSGSSGPWAPPITITGQSTTGNAIQFTTASGYLPAIDGGVSTPQGLPFQIYGEQGELEQCSGTPEAGSITGPSNICPNITFTLKAEGATSGFDGLERQWQSSPAGQNTWSDIPGANNVNYNVAGGISASTDYRFVMTCTVSGLSDMTATHTVNLNSPNECYCYPSISTVEPISRVILSDIDNSSDPNGTLPYEDFTSVIGNVAPGETYEGAFEGNTMGSYTTYFTVFIDWNQNGILNDAGEMYEIGSITNSNGTDGQQAINTVSVPDDATPGSTRMRVIKNFYTSPTNPCGTYSYGQVEDYTLAVGVIDDCTGTPDPGTITGPDSICANIGFTLKAVGASSGAAGLVRQWQSSLAGQNNWSDIAGANSTTYGVPAGISAAMDYRFVITCTPSGQSATSAVHTVNLNPGNECYCTPTTSYVEPISRVVLSDIDNSSDPNGTLSYEDFTDIIGNVAPGETYEGAFEGNTAGSYTNYFTVFIDWNQNGTLNDAGEVYEIGSITNSNGTDGQQAIGMVTVPDDAMQGTTRMRVVKNYNSSPTDPCGPYTFGQIEDYTLMVGTIDDCTGTPDPGTITGPDSICPNIGFILKAVGASSGAAGLTRQWQSSPAGQNNWSDIAGATNTTYNVTSGITTATDYRFVITCTASGQSATSATHSISINEALDCYCIPVFSSGCNLSDFIDDFILNGVNGTSINDLDTGCSPNAYEDRTDESVDLFVGMSYSAFVSVGTTGDTVVFWIDFDNSGSFEFTEMVGSLTSVATAGSQIPINIPSGAALGEHRMRVMNQWAGDPNTMNPCGNATWGEVHDYTVNILVKPDCEGTPNGGTVTVNPAFGNPGSAYTVSSTGYTNANNMVYQWQSNTAGAGWVNQGAALSEYADYQATAPTGIGVSVDWKLVVTCNTSGETAESTTATFVTVEPGCGFETPSNGFQDGFGYLEANERANDFTVPVNTRINVTQAKINVFIPAGVTIDAADISFYTDSGTGPGEYVGGLVFASPSSSVYAGSNFGIDVYTLTFDMNQLLDGNTATETVYWMGVLLYASGNTYWEVNYNLNSPNEFYSNDGSGNWTPSTVDYGQVADGVMQIIGECETLGSNDLTVYDFAYWPNPVKDVLNFSSQKGVKTVDVYNLTGQSIMKNAKVIDGQINLAGLSSGTFIIRVTLDGGEVETFKVLKK